MISFFGFVVSFLFKINQKNSKKRIISLKYKGIVRKSEYSPVEKLVLVGNTFRTGMNILSSSNKASR